MECLWTRHAEERQQEWQTKLGVTREEVEEVLRHPEPIVAGDQSALIAQSRRDDGFLTCPFSQRWGRSQNLDRILDE
jgi:hypothetical protein